MMSSTTVTSILAVKRTYRRVRNVELCMDTRGRQIVRWEEWMDIGFLWASNYQVFQDEARARKKVSELETYRR